VSQLQAQWGKKESSNNQIARFGGVTDQVLKIKNTFLAQRWSHPDDSIYRAQVLEVIREA
jgi:hypothetical protein